MSTQEALQEYDRCAKKIFSFRNKKCEQEADCFAPLFPERIRLTLLAGTTATEKYRATALKDVVQDLVRRRNMGEYLMDASAAPESKGQCFVCTMPARKVERCNLIRSFLVPEQEYDMEVKIWEAARATTAASFYFKPMEILRHGKGSTEECIDAAIGSNNPLDRLLEEAAHHIGPGRRLGCVVSIGTGTRLVKIDRASTGLRNILHLPKFLKELLGTLKNTATDAEEPHHRVLAKFASYPNAYFRFNVPDVADQVGLDKYHKIKTLKAATSAYLSQHLVAAQILNVAALLGRNASDHGLTLGHASKHGARSQPIPPGIIQTLTQYSTDMNKDQVKLATQEERPLGAVVMSRFFVAREGILGKLDTCFSPRDTRGKPRREFLLYGMGGVGKTEIALKTADALEDRQATPSLVEPSRSYLTRK